MMALVAGGTLNCGGVEGGDGGGAFANSKPFTVSVPNSNMYVYMYLPCVYTCM